MTIKKLIPCTLTAAVLASAALTGCSSKGTSDKSTTSAKTSAQETKETAKDTEAGSGEVNTSAEAKSEEESRRPRLSLEAKKYLQKSEPASQQMIF